MSQYRHGPQDCRACFENQEKERRMGDWKLTNNPGYYGSSTPETLVLGFSKGANQNKAADAGDFDKIAFAGARPRLQRVLETLDLMPEGRSIDALMTSKEERFGVASLVRCSLCKWKDGKWKTSGDVVPMAFTNETTNQIITRCVQKHLSNLPPTTKRVVLLGNGDAYIKKVSSLIRSIHHGFRPLSEVAFDAGGARWVFATHPSPLNGHFDAWVGSPSSHKSGKKRDLAVSALAALQPEGRA